MEGWGEWGDLTEMGSFEPDSDCLAQATELGSVVCKCYFYPLSTSHVAHILQNHKALDISMDLGEEFVSQGN